MAQWYKILKADPLGQPWTPNAPKAKPIQNYWCQVEGLDKDVSIGKQVRDDGQPALHPGQHVYGDLVYAKSQRGTEYWKFKSQQVPEDEQPPASTPAPTPASQFVGDYIPGWFVPFGNIIIDLQKDMKLLKGDEPNITGTATAITEEKVEQIGGEPLDEETKKTLDNIFTPPEVPEDK